MKSSKFISFLLVLVVIGLAGVYFYQSNQGATPEAMSETGEQMSAEPAAVAAGMYTVNTAESEIGWYGDKVLIPGGDHAGTITVQEGSLVVDDSGLISEGMVTIDMTSIALAEGDTGGQDLLNHLASDDFFSTATYPTAMLEVESSEQTPEGLSVNGVLTIKDISNPVNFMVMRQITETDAVLHTGTLVFDRSLYDVRFGSGSFFDNLGDNVIGDDIELTFSLVAEPEA
jgi:polyisoprenoid-binding protein YceI